MKTYTQEEMLHLAGEIVRINDQLTVEEVMEAVSRCFVVDEEGMFVCSPRHADKTQQVINGLFDVALEKSRGITERRPEILECDVRRFQNKKEKWVAFVGLLDGRPYEIFTGLQDDEEGIALPKSCNSGVIIKRVLRDGSKRYDFQFQNRRGYKTTIEGLSEKFNPEYWNYAKLISGVLRYRMPIENVIKLIDSLQLETETINTWKSGVARALKKYTGEGDTDDQEV